MIKLIRKIALSPLALIIGIPLLLNTAQAAQTGPLAEVKQAIQAVGSLSLPTSGSIERATHRAVSNMMVASNGGGRYTVRPVYISGGPIFLN